MKKINSYIFSLPDLNTQEGSSFKRNQEPSTNSLFSNKTGLAHYKIKSRMNTNLIDRSASVLLPRNDFLIP